MPTPGRGYWDQVEPTDVRLDPGYLGRVDFYRAWDRLAHQLWTVLPHQLDRARKWRNRYDDAVKV